MKSIDVKDMKFIDAGDVPPVRGQGTNLDKWDKILGDIPPGMALVIPPGMRGFHPTTCGSALRRRHKKGLFMNYQVFVKGSNEGDKTVYLINHKEKI